MRKILIDRTYLGWTIGGNTAQTSIARGEKKQGSPQRRLDHYKGTHEPIVSEGLFDCVQKYFDDLKHTAGAATKYNCKSKQASIFKGHLRCGECGKAMFLRAKKNNGKTTWWYYCTLHENYNSSYMPQKGGEERRTGIVRSTL
ncbi:MAG: recombinase zinc beta ribbon domain-containing protein [Acutalibacteraceae bacterium]